MVSRFSKIFSTPSDSHCLNCASSLIGISTNALVESTICVDFNSIMGISVSVILKTDVFWPSMTSRSLGFDVLYNTSGVLTVIPGTPYSLVIQSCVSRRRLFLSKVTVSHAYFGPFHIAKTINARFQESCSALLIPIPFQAKILRISLSHYAAKHV